jgi:RNA polymerase sigma-70 factor (ECF subfamily)
MTMLDRQPLTTDDHATVAAATAGDEAAFTTLTRRYRRELHVHCYRMLASFEDAEDLVQETLLRAWQKRETFQGRASFRAWLYRIATNACLDFLARHRRRATEIGLQGDASPDAAVAPHVAWLQPYPDHLLELAAPPDGAPDAAIMRRETIELAFLVAMQFLPPKQRAVLILRDVLDWSASETAALLDASVPAVNAALQRARATLRRRKPARDHHADAGDVREEERLLLRRYIEATERNDVAALTRLLSHDVRFTMPPTPMAYEGSETVVRAWVEGGFGAPPFDDFRCLVVDANGMPAVANYIRRPGEAHYRPFALDVLRVERGAIAEITAFDLEGLAGAFAIPESIS